MKIGHKFWAIPEGYIPKYSHSESRELISHEAVCILNASDVEAKIELTIYYSDKDPVGPYEILVPPKRTKHVRFNDLNFPEPIPKGVDYASILVSNVEIIVQHTRLDSRQAENALMTTIAFGCQTI